MLRVTLRGPRTTRAAELALAASLAACGAVPTPSDPAATSAAPTPVPAANGATGAQVLTPPPVRVTAPGVPTAPTVPPTSTPDPFAARGAPARLEIPAIGVDTPLESLGIAADGQIEAPVDWDKAGWFRLGFRPGEAGHAVVAGHLDNDRGGPAVFWDLDELAPGDSVAVTYANGDRFAFVVETAHLIDRDAGDAATFEAVFGPSDTARLNLMTCDGAWEHGAATYSKRLVVGAALVGAGDAASERRPMLAPGD